MGCGKNTFKMNYKNAQKRIFYKYENKKEFQMGLRQS